MLVCHTICDCCLRIRIKIVIEPVSSGAGKVISKGNNMLSKINETIEGDEMIVQALSTSYPLYRVLDPIPFPMILYNTTVRRETQNSNFSTKNTNYNKIISDQYHPCQNNTSIIKNGQLYASAYFGGLKTCRCR
jgi:hypothetical protein